VNLIVFGATSGLGREIAYQGASQGFNLFLSSSNQMDLESITCDLIIKYKGSVDFSIVDFSLNNPQFGKVFQYINLCNEKSVHLLFPVGKSFESDTFIDNDNISMKIININFYSIVKFLSETAKHDLFGKISSISFFGSIASTRGRSENVIYSASKRALHSYYESLRHSLVNENIIVKFYLLGYLNTRLADGHSLKFTPANPTLLAKSIVDNLEVDTGLIFYPKFWRLITLLLRLVPWSIFKRLKF